MGTTNVLKTSTINTLENFTNETSFFLASPFQTIFAEGTFRIVRHCQSDKYSEFVHTVLHEAEQAGHPNPIVVGALPFDCTNTMQLIVPQKSTVINRLQFNNTDQDPPQLPTFSYEIKPVPNPSEYTLGVEKAVRKIKNGDMQKVVLSRALDVHSAEKVNTKKLLYDLARHNEHGYTFAVDLPNTDANGDSTQECSRTIIGASPELLVSRRGMQVISNPLAGSRPRSKDPVEDKRRADELLSSVKDLHEHKVVVEAVVAALRPYCRTLSVPEKPSLINSQTMWHLSTEVKGELYDESISALELALALHPTPAVCGTPTEKARVAIKEIEKFNRGFFTGIIGWSDLNGDGEWIVTIRCAEVDGNSLRLFAGAGIVAESIPEDELAETTAKFRTMLQALGLKNTEL